MDVNRVCQPLDPHQTHQHPVHPQLGLLVLQNGLSQNMGHHWRQLVQVEPAVHYDQLLQQAGQLTVDVDSEVNESVLENFWLQLFDEFR